MPESPLVIVDDKHVPLYRVVWVADVPHFCGEEDCGHEGDYEVRLDIESIWTTAKGRDEVIRALNAWCGDPGPSEDPPY